MEYQKFSEIEKALKKGEKEIVVKIANHKGAYYSEDAIERKFKEQLPRRRVHINICGNNYYVYVR